MTSIGVFVCVCVCVCVGVFRYKFLISNWNWNNFKLILGVFVRVGGQERNATKTSTNVRQLHHVKMMESVRTPKAPTPVSVRKYGKERTARYHNYVLFLRNPRRIVSLGAPMITF